MPGFDRTGPGGQGPMTGGGFGLCGSGSRAGAGFGSGNRGGFGLGQRFRRGFAAGGRGRGFGRYYSAPYTPAPMEGPFYGAEGPGPQEADIAGLSDALAAIERRLARLEDEMVEKSSS